MAAGAGPKIAFLLADGLRPPPRGQAASARRARPLRLRYRLQKPGVNKSRTVKISSRPAIIRTDRTHFPAVGTWV